MVPKTLLGTFKPDYYYIKIHYKRIPFTLLVFLFIVKILQHITSIQTLASSHRPISHRLQHLNMRFSSILVTAVASLTYISSVNGQIGDQCSGPGSYFLFNSEFHLVQRYLPLESSLVTD